MSEPLVEEVNTEKVLPIVDLVNSSNIAIIVKELMEDMLKSIEQSAILAIDHSKTTRVASNNFDPLPAKYTIRFEDPKVQMMFPLTEISIGKPSLHPHVRGQFTRDVQESIGYAYLCKTYRKFNLVLIGDNTVRSGVKGIIGHSLNYHDGSAADELRQEKYKALTNNGNTVCYCGDLQPKLCIHCAHLTNLVTMSVDSSYYDNIPMNTAERLYNGTIMAHMDVCGIFQAKDGIYKSMGGETIIEVSNDNITMGVIGNYDGAYYHKRSRVASTMLTTDNSSETLLAPYKDGYIKRVPIHVMKWDDNYHYSSAIYTYVKRDAALLKNSQDYNTLLKKYESNLLMPVAGEQAFEEPDNGDIEIVEQSIVIKQAGTINSLLGYTNNGELSRYEGESGGLISKNGHIYVYTKDASKINQERLSLLQELQYEVKIGVDLVQFILKNLRGQITKGLLNGICKMVIVEFGEKYNMNYHLAALIVCIITDEYALDQLTLNKYLAKPLILAANNNELSAEQISYDNDVIKHNVVEGLVKHVAGLPEKGINSVVSATEWLNKDSLGSVVDTFTDKVTAGIRAFKDLGLTLISKLRNLRRPRAAVNVAPQVPALLMMMMCLSMVGLVGSATIPNTVENIHYHDFIRGTQAFNSCLQYILLAFVFMTDGLTGLVRYSINYLLTYIVVYLVQYYGFYCSLFILTLVICNNNKHGRLAWVLSILSFLHIITGINAVRIGDIDIPYVMYGSCTPNNVAEMLQCLVNRKLLSTSDNKDKTAPIQSTHTLRSLSECDNSYLNVMKQKSPLFIGEVNTQPFPHFLHSCKASLSESIYRQNAAETTSDPVRVAHFAEYYLKEYINPFVEFCGLQTTEICQVNWLNRYTGAKRANYEQAVMEYTDKSYQGSFSKLVDKMTNFSKTNEKIYVDYKSKIPKIKSRNITEQNGIIKVILGPLIDYISRNLKKFDPAFGSGLNMEERAVKFEQWTTIIPNYDVICIDGSAFDSTQFTEILKVTDEALYLRIIQEQYPQIANYCNVDDLIEIVTTHTQRVKSKYCKYIVEGTIPSGSMKTSQGNTSRSAAYSRYIFHMIGATEKNDFFIETCGDDTIIIVDKFWTRFFIDAAYKYVYSDTMDKKNHGLGQIAKMIEVYPSIDGLNADGKQAEYLSCYFLRNDHGQIKMIRKLDRLIQLNPWTQSNLKNNLKDEATLNKQLTKGDGVEILSWCGDIEFFREYAAMLISLAGNVQAKQEAHHQYTIRSDSRSGNFNKAFLIHIKNMWDINVDELYSLMRAMRKMKNIYGSFTTSVIDKLWPTTNSNLRSCTNFLNEKRQIAQITINKKKCRDQVQMRSTIYEDFNNEFTFLEKVFDLNAFGG